MDQAQLQRRVQLEKSVRRFREMFQGNVPLELAVLLMKRYHNNYTLVTKHIILMFIDPETGGLDDDDRNDIEEDDEIKVNVAYVLCFQQAFRALKQVMAGLTVKNLDLFNQANEKLIPSKERQFSCSQCDRYWWRRVPARKQVSRCRHCKKKYDPVPYDKMWGYAEFNCQECGHNFGGFTQMGLPSPCYVCGSQVTPVRILPPKRSLAPRSHRPHSCFAEDCYNRREPYIPGTHCVHPRSRQRQGLPKVLFQCPEHDSTGSTVATCVSQGSLMECPVEEILEEDILEEEEDPTEEEEDSTEKSDSGDNEAED
ncbi:shiftless antiviral inhibitor of ribosomal frameshifting protein homolog isoform X2 [Narcine bancroftii]|uniref:shiftless antiviral inhibitor of ribosomal frameshifting protein homolog isoform X2 n=1 Tax=Narcine bancroftii TaxID=1343680 RepID=UPI003831D425